MQYFHLLHQKTQAAQIANVSLAPVPVGGPVNNIPTVTGLPPISPSPASQSSIPATQILTTQTNLGYFLLLLWKKKMKKWILQIPLSMLVGVGDGIKKK